VHIVGFSSNTSDIHGMNINNIKMYYIGQEEINFDGDGWVQWGVLFNTVTSLYISNVLKCKMFLPAQQMSTYEGISKIFRTDAVQIITTINKRVWKLPTSTQLRSTWHTDSLDMVVLPSTGASRYYNCFIDGGTSPEYFGYPLLNTLHQNDFVHYYRLAGSGISTCILVVVLTL
jgi:hypothetical protein